MLTFFLCFFFLHASRLAGGQSSWDRGRPPAAFPPSGGVPMSCYDSQGRPKRCIPPFVNAAYNMEVEATSTCGLPAIQFCRQTGATGATRECDICDARSPSKSHPPRFLTDFWNDNLNQTWWQSETMLQGVHRSPVNLTLDLHKTFEITYVRLRFRTSVPESFAIFKKTEADRPWEPYQYYSASCRSTYGVDRRGYVRVGNEKVALCTDEFSDISPLTNANVPFSTLESRPSRDRFNESEELQEWVTASALRITLDRLNTFGDEVFHDPKVLKSYYYAISDLSVGGRCKCNGHASHCVMSTGEGLSARLVCQCEHHTTGPDCGECLPFYQDRPWGKATEADPRVCRACECNGLSHRCSFDEDLFRRTGRGGRCLDCRKNTAGPHCEECKVGFYRDSRTSDCVPCGCDPLGSLMERCDVSGRCTCHTGVDGDKCDRCEQGHFGFSHQGCRSCTCSDRGSVNNSPSCDVETGRCRCKENVEGDDCDRCKPGFFNLDKSNDFGCTSCFCFGHSSACRSASQFRRRTIASDFRSSADGWTSVDSTGADSGVVAWNRNEESLSHDRGSPVYNHYFNAPDRFLGDQRFSYNQRLSFRFSISSGRAQASRADVVIEGRKFTVSIPIFEQGNSIPDQTPRLYTFRLHEHPNYSWSPRLTSAQFQELLSDVLCIKIRATYTSGGAGELDDVQLESAALGKSREEGADFVEQCSCPKGYVGQFCEDCAPGFRREMKNGDNISPCVPCTCNGHSSSCDVATGRCICDHNTDGENCERCRRGFFGDATRGRLEDCQKCPCPSTATCVEREGMLVCVGCPIGYAGPRCKACAEGFFGSIDSCDADQIGHGGCICRPCTCHNNVDANAIGNCDARTGRCFKCIHNTEGRHCERCLPGHFGVAVIPGRHANCTRCECHPRGTVDGGFGSCGSDGSCRCVDRVGGRRCDRPERGFRWNPEAASGGGVAVVIACGCDSLGAVGPDCSEDGQCLCKPGVAGRKCDVCAKGFFDLSSQGCRPCGCDPVGSMSRVCDPIGRCICVENVVGDKCDRCAENMFGLDASTRRCFECPGCYSLVQRGVEKHRKEVKRLKNILAAGVQQHNVTDEEAERMIEDVEGKIDEFYQRVTKAPAPQRFQSFSDDFDRLLDFLDAVDRNKTLLIRTSDVAGLEVDAAEDARERSEEKLLDFDDLLEELKDWLKRAKELETKDGLGTEKLAKESESLAEAHRNSATSIIDTASKAASFSNDANERLNVALENATALSVALQRLRADVESLDFRFQRTREKSRENYDEAEANLRESHRLFEEVRGHPPGVSEIIKKNTAKVKKQAKTIERASNSLKSRHREILNKVETAIAEGNRIFEEALAAQQTLEALLEEAMTAKMKAEEARKLIEPPSGILGEAQRTLETLSNFDKRVTSSQQEAEDALSRVDDILKLLDHVEKSVAQLDARWTRNRSEKTAQRAFDNSKEAYNLSALIEVNATSLVTETAETSKIASEVRRRAQGLQSFEFQSAETQLRDVETTTKMDVERAVASTQEARKTTQKSGVTIIKADDTLARLQKIMDELARLGDPEPLDYKGLESQLKDVENKVKDLMLDELIAQFEVGGRQQEKFLELVAAEADKMEAEVTNVEMIRAALPFPERSECPQLLEQESNRK